jgi:hypothetical protein
VVKDKADKVELHRPYYPLAEAAEMSGYKDLDLIHMAEQRELPVRIIAGDWRLHSVFMIDDFNHKNSMDFQFVDPKILDSFHFLLDGEEHVLSGASDKIVAQIQGHGSPPRNRNARQLHDLYKWVNSRYASVETTAVSPYCLTKFLIDQATATIALDIASKIFGPIVGHQCEIRVRTKPEILVKDALAADKLVVMQRDLAVLIAKTSPSPVVEEATPPISVPENVESLVAERVRQAKSEHARKGGLERHKDTNAVKKIVWDLYASGKWNRVKVEAAAEEIFDQLPEHHHLFASGNGVVTFQRWIYAYKKEQRKEG